MAPQPSDLDPTTPTRTIYQEVALSLTIRKVAPLLELCVTLRRYQKAYYSSKDPAAKQEFLVQAKIKERELDKQLEKMGLKS